MKNIFRRGREWLGHVDVSEGRYLFGRRVLFGPWQNLGSGARGAYYGFHWRRRDKSYRVFRLLVFRAPSHNRYGRHWKFEFLVYNVKDCTCQAPLSDVYATKLTTPAECPRHSDPQFKTSRWKDEDLDVDRKAS